MTTVAAPEAIVADSVDEVRRILMREMIDKGVRAARAGGWCQEFERSMNAIFPDGHPDGLTNARTGAPAWVDSDGFDCRGRDRDGFGEDGFDADGYDRDRYDRNGLHYETRLTRDGFNRYGYDSDGYDRQGFTQYGIHRDGYDVAGNTVGTPEHEEWLYRFDQRGYDADGFNATGMHRDTGLNRAEHARRFRFDLNGRERRAS